MWQTKGPSRVLSSNKLQESADSIKYFEKLFQPLDELPSEPESDVSDLTDIFEEFHRGSFLRVNADPEKKYLTKVEADWRTAESFTNEFKKTMKVMRKELDIDDSMLDEEKAVTDILNSKQPFKITTLNIESDPITVRKQNIRKGSNFSDDSTTWQMLSANSDSSFKITHPILHLLGEENKHWLERPDISWKKVDESRLKCESWFREK
ncbi:uncharacterized protein [Leptinotarsa decemlineata]|uniref:uncharacterized protein n=1 Tax=Leptinotarsa decemlineata TaxID=7539 RepID=UPI003D3096F7